MCVCVPEPLSSHSDPPVEVDVRVTRRTTCPTVGELENWSEARSSGMNARSHERSRNAVASQAKMEMAVGGLTLRVCLVYYVRERSQPHVTALEEVRVRI